MSDYSKIVTAIKNVTEDLETAEMNLTAAIEEATSLSDDNINSIQDWMRELLEAVDNLRDTSEALMDDVSNLVAIDED